MDAIFRAAVAAVHNAFAGAAIDVVHESWIGHKPGGYAEPDYAAGVARRAVVQEGSIPLRLSTGDVITVRAVVSFLASVPANGAAGRHEPIDPRDRIRIPHWPEDQVGVIVDNPGGSVDPATGRPYANTVWLK